MRHAQPSSPASGARLRRGRADAAPPRWAVRSRRARRQWEPG